MGINHLKWEAIKIETNQNGKLSKWKPIKMRPTKMGGNESENQIK
jgi:hypothetical protein